jgi:phosphoribosylformimino-5-aminoimidazole carboxamide ribonucleotide (ProFAR) isomerase
LADQYGIALLDSAESLTDVSIAIIGSYAVDNEKIRVIEWCERHGKHVILDKPIVTWRKQLDRHTPLLLMT